MMTPQKGKGTPDGLPFIKLCGRCGRRMVRLTLGELEAPTGAAAAVFFPLLDPAVAGDETCFFQGTPQFGIDFQKGFGDTMFDSARLTGRSAAKNVDEYVEFAHGIGQLQGLAEDHLGGGPTEVFLDRPFIDQNLPRAGLHPDPGDGGFSFAGGVKSLFCHLYLPNAS